MEKYPMRDMDYRSLNNELAPPMGSLLVGGCGEGEGGGGGSAVHDPDHEDTSVRIMTYNVAPSTGKIVSGRFTHIEDLDSFFTRIYRYYLRGGFYPMLIADCLQLVQFCFIVWFSTFLVHCVNYPKLFRDEPGANRTEKISLSDVIYPTAVCVDNISWKWWCAVCLCSVIWLIRLVRTMYNLYFAYDTKMFYNHALKIQDSELAWINWCTVQTKAREAQAEERMCVNKMEINELDIYHRILRFNNYLVAMVNKKLLPLQINVPFTGEFHYLSKGLKYNLELLLFFGPWSPWENCWLLRECYKDHSKRMLLARQLERQILILALLNFLLAPLIQAWQILYFFFSYAEVIKRSPGALGLRTWSLYARVALRHFNELDHELQERLTRAHKPATKYLASFSSPLTTVLAKNVAFLSASMLGVLVALSVYDEDVLTVEHVLTLITVLGCVLAGARALMVEEEGRYVTGPGAGEELLVQVLGHVHYLPAEWRGRAHTQAVAQHFQQLFQFRAVYLLFELLSPVLCPLLLYKLRARSLDIVDFYRNFTVAVAGIGDVCSFAQLDVRKHGNPEWQTAPLAAEGRNARGSQYEQGEGGKTELSLVAFSCRNPGWQPHHEQRRFLKSLRHSMRAAANVSLHPLAPNLHKTMLGSYIQQSMYGTSTPVPAVLSYYQQKAPFRLPNMDETSDEDEENSVTSSHASPMRTSAAAAASAAASTAAAFAAGPADDTDMSVSTLHLYDIHLSQTAGQAPLLQDPVRAEPCCASNCSRLAGGGSGGGGGGGGGGGWGSSEDTPLLRRP